ncbi:prepilin peptidase [Brevibacillus sp. IT-7CA2]|uniref:prepilin peptidase n=1 Tax=Brevibacillus sp. IT-7CA2 TaxID=3026436 RepID=UPI0039E0AD66
MMIIAFVVLLIASYTDWKWRKIPDVLTYSSIVIALMYQLFWGNIWLSLIAGIVVFGVMVGLAYVLNGGIGGGDIKLCTFLALALSYPLINPLLLVSFILAIIYAKIMNRKEVPLAPAILLGFIIVVPINM